VCVCARGISLVICVFSFQADDFSGLHANTHLPVLIGAQKRYEVVGDQFYKVTWMLVRVLTVCYPVVLFFNQQYKHAQVPFSLQFQLTDYKTKSWHRTYQRSSLMW
jgi:hypothetical protein